MEPLLAEERVLRHDPWAMPRRIKSQWEFAGDLFESKKAGGASEDALTPQPGESAPAVPEPSASPGTASRRKVADTGGPKPAGDGTTADSGAPAKPDDPVEPMPAAEPSIVSVTEFTRQVRRTLETRFMSVRVRGEISNFRMQSSGHAYFVLKDAGAQLSCVLFRGQAAVDRALLKDGISVVLSGEVTVYEPRGQYQLRVSAMEAEGQGALQVAFEKLKKKLKTEGLFDADRKRPIPRFPRRLGLVTSPTGAAIRDVLHVLQRRYPSLEIVLAPVRVQGAGAAAEIAAAVQALNRLTGARAVDVILVTRGGGSLEDLWAFNEEVVARALAASGVPVVSAVGHEIDFTISDFVADVRAATPSAAAEILTADHVASRGFLEEARQRMRRRLTLTLNRRRQELSDRERRLQRMHPRRVTERSHQLLDEWGMRLARAARRGQRDATVRWGAAWQRWKRQHPRTRMDRQGVLLAGFAGRLVPMVRNRLEGQRQRWATLRGALQLLSPQRVLERGYSITFSEAGGQVVRDAGQVSAGESLRTQLAHGVVLSVVRETQGAEASGGDSSEE